MSYIESLFDIFEKQLREQIEKDLQEKDEIIQKLQTIVLYQADVIQNLQTQPVSFLTEIDLENFHKKPVFYIGWIAHNIIKFGFSGDIKTRLSCHKRTFGNTFYLTHVLYNQYNDKIETLIKQHPVIKSKITPMKFCNTNQTELVTFDDNFGIDDFIDIYNELNDETELRKITLKSIKETVEPQTTLECMIESNATTYKCPRCDYQTTRKYDMEKHIEKKNICEPILANVNPSTFSIEELKIKYNCEYCDFSSTATKRYMEHVKQCTYKIDYKCLYCTFISTNKNKYVEHINNCTLKTLYDLKIEQERVKLTRLIIKNQNIKY